MNGKNMTVASFFAGLMIGALGVFTFTSGQSDGPAPGQPSDTVGGEAQTTPTKKVVVEEEPPPTVTEAASSREIVAARGAPDADLGVFVARNPG